VRLSSLRAKISLFFVFVILALVLSSFFQVNSSVETSLREVLEDQLKQNNQVFERLQAFTLKQIEGKATLGAHQKRLWAALKFDEDLKREQTPLAERLKNLDAVFKVVPNELKVDYFLVYGRDGELLFPTAQRNEAALARPAAVAAALGGAAAQQVIQLGGTLYLGAAAPVLYQDDAFPKPDLIGAVLVLEPLAPLAEDVSKVAGGQADVAIMSGDGAVLKSTLAGATRAAFDRALADRRPDFAGVLSGVERQALITLEIGGERRVALVIPICERVGAVGAEGACRVVGTLALARSLDAILSQEMEPIQQRLVVIGLVAILLTALINVVFARSITRPLSRLTAGLGQVAQGNLETQVAVTTRDEIGQLTRSFNEMVIGLSHKEKLMLMVSDAAARQVEGSAGAGLALGGKKERVTVFFSDIRNFTPMTEALGAAEIVDLLNRYFAVAGRVIAAHGGDIDKFIGDAIMVVFRDDEGGLGALKAVRCAVELQAQVAAFNAQPDRPASRPIISIGVGIATGEVVAGNVGTPQRLEYTVLGDTVNVAARLEGKSKEGTHLQVMLDPETYAEVRAAVEVEALTRTQLKGKAGPMTVYEVKGLTPG
jgi:class 3 adenylate cyclase